MKNSKKGSEPIGSEKNIFYISFFYLFKGDEINV